MATSSSRPSALSCRNIRVAFGEVTALAGISVDFPTGGIHAVVGQNGAGKTTFARVAAGLVKPDAGELSINGRNLRFGSVASARKAGVELVHQNFALPPSFTVAEAIEFSLDGEIGLFSRRQLLERCREYLNSLGMDIDPRRRIRELPIELQQAVEIARALVTKATVLILDEPTAVLPPTSIESLFDRIRTLRDNGVTVILILHKIREVWAVADTVSVLRNSRLVAGPIAREETDPDRIGNLIMGVGNHDSISHNNGKSPTRAAEPLSGARRETATAQPVSLDTVLEMKEVCTSVRTDEPCLNRISFEVRSGEIVGIAGVEGNGQLTLVQVLSDFVAVSSGEIDLCGAQVTGLDLAHRRSQGLRIIPFDRNREGLSLTSELWKNWSVRDLVLRPPLGLVNPSKLRARCAESLAEWGVRYNSTTQNAGSLSGGNAQKLILAREVDNTARLIVAAQPTRGLDIGATAFVWSTMRKARKRGCGVLLISSDLDELFDISQRVLVMLSGRIVSEFAPPFDIAKTGRAMTGSRN